MGHRQLIMEAGGGWKGKYTESHRDSDVHRAGVL